MTAQLLQDFRVVQLAAKGVNNKAEYIQFNGIECISIGDVIKIEEVSLETDSVVVKINDSKSLVSIHNLSDDIIAEVIATMKAVVLEIVGRDVMVTGNGEIVL